MEESIMPEFISDKESVILAAERMRQAIMTKEEFATLINPVEGGKLTREQYLAAAIHFDRNG